MRARRRGELGRLERRDGAGDLGDRGAGNRQRLVTTIDSEEATIMSARTNHAQYSDLGSARPKP